MANETSQGAEAAHTTSTESIAGLLSSPSESQLRALIDNPSVDESHICLLLKRRDLPETLLEEIARRKTWRASHRISRSLAEHPHTPRLVAMRLLRDLHLMDLVGISISPACRGELRRLAEERVLAQLAQLPLGQRRTVARRGSARIAGGLAAQGPEQVVRFALDNPRMTEAQVLRVLAIEALPSKTLAIIASHAKWSKIPNVLSALIRHRHTPLNCVRALAPGLLRHDLDDLLQIARIQEAVCDVLRDELARRQA
jgi:hypothetical protein